MSVRKLKMIGAMRKDDDSTVAMQFSRPVTYIEFQGICKLIEDQLKEQ